MLGVFKVFNPGQPAVASAILYTLSKADVFLNLSFLTCKMWTTISTLQSPV